MSFLQHDNDDINLLNFEEDNNLLNSEDYIFNNPDSYELLGIGSHNQTYPKPVIPLFRKGPKILTDA